jgi:hypothetical protein
MFICKAFKGAAVVFYCKPLITQQMGISGSALRGENILAEEEKNWNKR